MGELAVGQSGRLSPLRIHDALAEHSDYSSTGEAVVLDLRTAIHGFVGKVSRWG